MSSLWKDLLFLHGYLVRKEDLQWRDQAPVESTTRTLAAEANTDRSGAARTTGEIAPKHCPSRWPHLAAPH